MCGISSVFNYLDKIQYSNPIKDCSLFSYNKYLTNNIK